MMVFIHASIYDSHALCTNCSEICSKDIDKIRKFEPKSMCRFWLCIWLLNSISICRPFVKQLLYFCHPLLNFPSSIFLKHIMILFHFPFIFSIYLSIFVRCTQSGLVGQYVSILELFCLSFCNRRKSVSLASWPISNWISFILNSIGWKRMREPK